MSQIGTPDIDKLRRVEQEILDIYSDFCDARGLRYSIAYGTLLGAVRHGGFIPWDDDIDVVMPRADYNRFIDAWIEERPEGYVLDEHRINEEYTQTFAKLNKSNTVVLGEGVPLGRTDSYYGICIDVFPMDKVPDLFLSRLVQFVAACVNLLYLHRYRSGMKGLIGITEKLLLRLPAGMRSRLLVCADGILQHWNERDGTLCYVNASTFSESKLYYSPHLFDEFVKLPFNGREYRATKEWKSFLETMYGDYMQLPPVEERVWSHRPALVDLECSYADLTEERVERAGRQQDEGSP